MAFDLNFHFMASITATLVEPLPDSDMLGKSAWINLSINTLDGQKFVLTTFFHGDQVGLAKAYADAINGVPLVTEESCPGHIASNADPKVCVRCGTNIDSLRPPEDQPEPEVIF